MNSMRVLNLILTRVNVFYPVCDPTFVNKKRTRYSRCLYCLRVELFVSHPELDSPGAFALLHVQGRWFYHLSASH